MASTKQLYTLASELGLVDKFQKEDAFHILVYAVTKKQHVNELTEKESDEVLKNLLKRKKSEKKTVAGMMTVQQQKLAWRLIYRLAELDPNENVTVSERLVGAIKKVLGITPSRRDPFRWVNFSDGSKLIEYLKRYVRSAENKAKKH
jgi:hypothetical protein